VLSVEDWAEVRRLGRVRNGSAAALAVFDSFFLRQCPAAAQPQIHRVLAAGDGIVVLGAAGPSPQVMILAQPVENR
jgi:hypothetical protein